MSKTGHHELHSGSFANKLNWLRASVLGANDGIISLAALVVGVAGATTTNHILLLTGVAGILAGALSMAVGEYISVSSQRDTEHALLTKEKYELEHFEESELEELISLYEKKGLSRETAERVAKELTIHDAFAAHVEAELGIDPENLSNPVVAAVASAVSFTLGAIVPFVAVLVPPEALKVPITFASVLVALVITGLLSARASGAPYIATTWRVVVGGLVAMAVTYGIGRLFNVQTG